MTRATLFRPSDNYEEYLAGETIFNQGDEASSMYVIIEGQVQIVFMGQTLRVLGADDAFGEMALIDSTPRSTGAVAKTDVKLARVDQRRFLFLIQQSPSFALRIMKIMADRLRDMTHAPQAAAIC